MSTAGTDVRPYGDQALLVEPADPTSVLALRDALTAAPWVSELVPAARTLLVAFDPAVIDAPVAAAEISTAAATVAAAQHPVAAGAALRLPVRYDGDDLEAVAAELGCSVPALIAQHSGTEYTVAFCGFAPGFAYLSGLAPQLHVPRLATPRTAVPAGSVGIAGEFTGVYPRASPGGWRLLGRTAERLWDTDRTPPALLTPGTRVRFVPA